MNVLCPHCRQPVPAEKVNVTTDLAMCPACENVFKVSESVDLGSIDERTLEDSPPGTWYTQEIGGFTVGASTRSWIALFLIPFTCVWSGGSMIGIYGTQIAAGEFNPFISLFGIPFILGSIFLWTVTLMAVCGKVVVTVIDDEGTIFVGLGSIGWRRRLDWGEVNSIREENNTVGYPGGYMRGILLEGKSRLKFGTNLNEKRRYFMLNALKYLRTTTR